MARSQMLYIGKQGAVKYQAVGNIKINDGDSGTVAMWYHPCSRDQWCPVLTAYVDGGNHLVLSREKDVWRWLARRNGNSTYIDASSNPVAWRFVVATWDFSAGPGAGILRLYLDGEEVAGSPLTTASAPTGLPATITLGPGELNERAMAHATFDQLAIWDEAISPTRVAALHERGRHHVPQEADGSGALLLRASWNEQFDADLAQGSAAATLIGAADQYCRLDCRSRHAGKRFRYPIGMPAHDGSEDDRVPLYAVLSPRDRGTVGATNTADFGRLDVNASGQLHSVGAGLAPWLPEPLRPMTLRAGVHLASLTAPNSSPVAVGAHRYYDGDAKQMQAGAGCTTTTVVSSLLTEPDGYWAGAELHILSGALRGQKLRIADSSQSGHSLTIEGQLAQAPAQGDWMIVTEPRRLEPPHGDGHLYRLECSLTESHQGTERFAILETASIGSWGYSRVNLGRIQYYPYEVTADDVFFGRRENGVIEPSWQCSLLIDRLEMDGPGSYELTARTDDTFLVADPASGESIKALRVESLERELRQPAQHLNPSAVREAMTEPGSWRESVAYCPSWMAWDAANDRLVAVVVGVDAGGVRRVGYIHGAWNEAGGLVEWEDDPDPRNPFLTIADLDAVLGGRSSPFNRVVRVNGVFEVEEGNWALTFTATLGDPDGYTTCALLGAPDRYSFDPREHFDPQLNPLTPPLGGNDKVVPEGSGVGLFGNRDCEVLFVENPWAKRRGDRFWGYGRAKTVNQSGLNLAYEPARPLSCVVTGDFTNLRHLPWRNQVVAPAYGWFHWPHTEWFAPSTVALVADDGGATQSDVGLWVAEDGVHFRRVMTAVPRNTPPFNDLWLMPQANPARLGSRRLYWYRKTKSGNDFNIATIRVDGEALYRLTDGAVEGELETCGLLREGASWDELRLNVDPKGGALTVAVLDTQSGSPIAGFDHDDCDAIAEAVDGRVTWNGVGLAEAPNESIRLVFRLTRLSAGEDSPELYAWSIAAPLRADRPRVTAVQVEGRTNPARIADPAPDFAWSYEDRLDRPQSAYHLLVASTQAKLDANEGDLWDSGVVLSEEPVAKYAGAQLASERTYFWKVRVRNNEGVWSEEW